MSFESFLEKEKDKVVTSFREDEKHLKDLHGT